MREDISRKEDVYIYVFRMPSSPGEMKDCPPERRKEIDEASREQRKKELYYGWKLLEYGAMDAFGVSPAAGDGGHNKDGKVNFGGICCSLSHSGDLIACAFSRENVGVDVERCVRGETLRKIAKHILTQKEALEAPSGSGEEFDRWVIRCWTEKESLFKRDGGDGFDPTAFDTIENRDRLFGVTLLSGGESYRLSAAISRKGTVPFLRFPDLGKEPERKSGVENPKITLSPENGLCYNI